LPEGRKQGRWSDISQGEVRVAGGLMLMGGANKTIGHNVAVLLAQAVRPGLGEPPSNSRPGTGRSTWTAITPGSAVGGWSHQRVP